LFIPMVAYAFTYLLTFNHVIAIFSIGGVSLSELMLALYLLKRNK